MCLFKSIFCKCGSGEGEYSLGRPTITNGHEKRGCRKKYERKREQKEQRKNKPKEKEMNWKKQ
jgi:hypothetical protein